MPRGDLVTIDDLEEIIPGVVAHAIAQAQSRPAASGLQLSTATVESVGNGTLEVQLDEDEPGTLATVPGSAAVGDRVTVLFKPSGGAAVLGAGAGAGNPGPGGPFVRSAGDTMTGPLVIDENVAAFLALSDAERALVAAPSQGVNPLRYGAQNDYDGSDPTTGVGLANLTANNVAFALAWADARAWHTYLMIPAGDYAIGPGILATDKADAGIKGERWRTNLWLVDGGVDGSICIDVAQTYIDPTDLSRPDTAIMTRQPSIEGISIFGTWATGASIGFRYGGALAGFFEIRVRGFLNQWGANGVTGKTGGIGILDQNHRMTLGGVPESGDMSVTEACTWGPGTRVIECFTGMMYDRNTGHWSMGYQDHAHVVFRDCATDVCITNGAWLYGTNLRWETVTSGHATSPFTRTVTDAVMSNASPTVTSATARFASGDVGRLVTGTNIPANTYVGIVNSATSIGLSSSATTNTPVNATGSATDLTIQGVTDVFGVVVEQGSLILTERTVAGATTTSGSPTVTGAFTADDLGRTVDGTGIPATAFVGAVTPGVSIDLSSSPVANVPINATASGTVTIIIDKGDTRPGSRISGHIQLNMERNDNGANQWTTSCAPISVDANSMWKTYGGIDVLTASPVLPTCVILGIFTHEGPRYMSPQPSQTVWRALMNFDGDVNTPLTRTGNYSFTLKGNWLAFLKKDVLLRWREAGAGKFKYGKVLSVGPFDGTKTTVNLVNSPTRLMASQPLGGSMQWFMQLPPDVPPDLASSGGGGGGSGTFLSDGENALWPTSFDNRMFTASAGHTVTDRVLGAGPFFRATALMTFNPSTAGAQQTMWVGINNSFIARNAPSIALSWGVGQLIHDFFEMRADTHTGQVGGTYTTVFSRPKVSAVNGGTWTTGYDVYGLRSGVTVAGLNAVNNRYGVYIEAPIISTGSASSTPVLTAVATVGDATDSGTIHAQVTDSTDFTDYDTGVIFDDSGFIDFKLVASGSDTVHVNTFAGSGVLHLNSITDVPTSGFVAIADFTGAVKAVITFTGTSSSGSDPRLTGCTWVSTDLGDQVLSTGLSVAYVTLASITGSGRTLNLTQSSSSLRDTKAGCVISLDSSTHPTAPTYIDAGTVNAFNPAGTHPTAYQDANVIDSGGHLADGSTLLFIDSTHSYEAAWADDPAPVPGTVAVTFMRRKVADNITVVLQSGASLTTGGMTNNYGVYIEDMAGLASSANYGIYNLSETYLGRALTMNVGSGGVYGTFTSSVAATWDLVRDLGATVIDGSYALPSVRFRGNSTTGGALLSGGSINAIPEKAWDATHARARVMLNSNRDGTSSTLGLAVDGAGNTHMGSPVGTIVGTTNYITAAGFSVDASGNVWIGPTAFTNGTPTAALATINAATGKAVIGALDATGIVHFGASNQVTIGTAGNFTLAAGVNFILDTATGTKIGTGTTQKLGFFNATPVAVQTGWGTPSGSGPTRTTFNDTTVTTAQLAQRVNALIVDLLALGLIHS